MSAEGPTHFTVLGEMVQIGSIVGPLGALAIPFVLGSFLPERKWRASLLLVLLAIAGAIMNLSYAHAVFRTCDKVGERFYTAVYGYRCVAFELGFGDIGRVLLTMLPAFALGAVATYLINRVRRRNA